MRKVELAYIEVLNETEQFLLFTAKFNGETYGNSLVLNTALKVEHQDMQIQGAIEKLETMTRKEAKEAKA